MNIDKLVKTEHLDRFAIRHVPTLPVELLQRVVEVGDEKNLHRGCGDAYQEVGAR